VIRRLQAEDGFGLIELMIAVTVLTVALLGLAAGYDQAFLSLHRASTKSVATELADKQLELYRSLDYASIGLDQTAYANATTVGGAGYDSTYAADAAAIAASDPVDATPATIAACGSTPQCSPVQSIVGSDGRTYRLESFVRNVPESVTGVSWAELVATVIVRDPGQAGSPEIVRETSAYDRSSD
jgi:prepilin-type N-terminal cleavage/methylation domain-containing protein